MQGEIILAPGTQAEKAETVEQVKSAAQKVGFPVIIELEGRKEAADICSDMGDLLEFVTKNFRNTIDTAYISAEA